MITRMLARWAVRRVEKYLEGLSFFEKEQRGFRRGRSTRDVIYIARIIYELYADWGRFLLDQRSKYQTAGTWGKHQAALTASYQNFQSRQA
eukprot:9075746-Pyramimonas_sp.AAC.1